MKQNLTVSFESFVAEIIEEHATKSGISKSKYVNDAIKAEQKTPREKIVEIAEAMIEGHNKLTPNNIKNFGEIIKKNISKV